MRRTALAAFVLIVATIALRAQPGATTSTAQPPGNSVFALVVTAVLLGLSLAVVLIGAASARKNRTQSEAESSRRSVRTIAELSAIVIGLSLLGVAAFLLLRPVAGAVVTLVVVAGLAALGLAYRRRTKVPRATRAAIRLAGTTSDTGDDRAMPATLTADMVAAGLSALADGSDPRSAIVATYRAMEHELAATAVELELSDTPAELIARAVESGVLPAGSADRLLDLFSEARFSTHIMTEQQRAQAHSCLVDVRAAIHAKPMAVRDG